LHSVPITFNSINKATFFFSSIPRVTISQRQWAHSAASIVPGLVSSPLLPSSSIASSLSSVSIPLLFVGDPGAARPKHQTWIGC
jgi:hypothetical protein